VDDVFGALFFKNAGYGALISDICPVKCEAGLCGKQAKAGLLECRVIIVVEVVKAVHGLAIAQKALCNVKADETGGSGN
jgi:hypothetical protein